MVIHLINSRGHYCLTKLTSLLFLIPFFLPFTNKSLSQIVNGYRSRSWVSYLWGDNLSEDRCTDCSERLFISTIMQDRKGESGQDYQRGYARVLISNEAACKLGSLSPMKIQTAVYFNFMQMEGCFSLKGEWGLRGGCAYKGRVGLDLEKCPFCPRVSGRLNYWSTITPSTCSHSLLIKKHDDNEVPVWLKRGGLNNRQKEHWFLKGKEVNCFCVSFLVCLSISVYVCMCVVYIVEAGLYWLPAWLQKPARHRHSSSPLMQKNAWSRPNWHV